MNEQLAASALMETAIKNWTINNCSTIIEHRTRCEDGNSILNLSGYLIDCAPFNVAVIPEAGRLTYHIAHITFQDRNMIISIKNETIATLYYSDPLFISKAIKIINQHSSTKESVTRTFASLGLGLPH
jgi:hypothetical protein